MSQSSTISEKELDDQLDEEISEPKVKKSKAPKKPRVKKAKKEGDEGGEVKEKKKRKRGLTKVEVLIQLEVQKDLVLKLTAANEELLKKNNELGYGCVSAREKIAMLTQRIIELGDVNKQYQTINTQLRSQIPVGK
jgi:hypothetical protein